MTKFVNIASEPGDTFMINLDHVSLIYQMPWYPSDEVPEGPNRIVFQFIEGVLPISQNKKHIESRIYASSLTPEEFFARLRGASMCIEA